MTDYCTGWPDGWPIWLGGTGREWGELCCKPHDLYYQQNADNLNWFDFLGAHWELAQCVGGVMGAVMYAGLCTFGLLFWINLKNKYRPPSR